MSPWRPPIALPCFDRHDGPPSEPTRLEFARQERNTPLPTGFARLHLCLDRPRKGHLDNIRGSRNVALFGIPSAIDGLDRDWVLWLARYRLASMGGAVATWSRKAQQRLNFLPEPQGQGAPRAAVAGRAV